MPINHLLDSVLNFISDNLSNIAGMNSGWCVLAGLLAFSAWERKHPAWHWQKSLLQQSYKTNASLFIANNLMVSLLLLPNLLTLAEYWAKPNLSDMLSLTGQAILSFLLFDLSLYLWHRASHHYGWLWQFHRIHHSDITMNVTTAFRLHVMDHMTLALVKAVYIVLLGFSKECVVMNEIINTLFLIFHHSNIGFKGEPILGKLIITPKLHRLHHSYERREHDRNYGAILSLWDRLFDSFAEDEPKRLGIKGNIAEDWLGLLIAGFTQATSAQTKLHLPEYVLNSMIAEAAYYKAEKRNFKPGNELSDWLEAKREIVRKLYGQLPAAERTYTGFTISAGQRLCC